MKDSEELLHKNLAWKDLQERMHNYDLLYLRVAYYGLNCGYIYEKKEQ